jgi:hypothetical protein
MSVIGKTELRSNEELIRTAGHQGEGWPKSRGAAATAIRTAKMPPSYEGALWLASLGLVIHTASTQAIQRNRK